MFNLLVWSYAQIFLKDAHPRWVRHTRRAGSVVTRGNTHTLTPNRTVHRLLTYTRAACVQPSCTVWGVLFHSMTPNDDGTSVSSIHLHVLWWGSGEQHPSQNMMQLCRSKWATSHCGTALLNAVWRHEDIVCRHRNESAIDKSNICLTHNSLNEIRAKDMSIFSCYKFCPRQRSMRSHAYSISTWPPRN